MLGEAYPAAGASGVGQIPGNAAGDGALARAGLAQQGGGFAAAQREADVREGGHVLAVYPIGHAQIFDAEQDLIIGGGGVRAGGEIGVH
ncbi:hypothetical protein FQZ97_1160780 [compost metagenome]